MARASLCGSSPEGTESRGGSGLSGRSVVSPRPLPPLSLLPGAFALALVSLMKAAAESRLRLEVVIWWRCGEGVASASDLALMVGEGKAELCRSRRLIDSAAATTAVVFSPCDLFVSSVPAVDVGAAVVSSVWSIVRGAMRSR